jgi:hypothetical protein
MQYLMSVIADDMTTAGTDEEMAAITSFNQGLQRDGYWVFAGGLGAPANATVVDNTGGDSLITDGPFVETKEYVIGLWILEAPDLDVALSLATGASKACNRRVEVRPFLVR